MNIAFNDKSLFAKAKLYIQRALHEQRTDENPLFPFWLSLALELLARSTLSSISPLLLADNKSNDGIQLLNALGFESTEKPRSIEMRSVLERLTKVNIEFFKEDRDFCLTVVEQRNTELHSGAVGYEEYPARIWLSDYYRICKILLKAQKMTLADFLGDEEATAAEIMITEDEANVKAEVLRRISSCKRAFLALEETDREIKKEEASKRLEKIPFGSRTLSCPACENEGILSGKLISVSDPKLEDEDIRQEHRYLPELFICYACNLRIDNYAELKASELGAQYSVTDYLDPVEYHSINLQEQIDAEIERISGGEEYADE